MLRAADVHCGGALRIGLGAVDVGPRRRVQHEVDLAELGGGGSVTSQSARVSAATRSGNASSERGPELAAGARYDDVSRAERIGDVVLQRWRTRSSSHGMPCSSGSAASYSSVTRYMKRQSVSAS